MSKTAFNTSPKVVLPNGKGPLIVEGDGIEVEFLDGKIHVRSGEIASMPTQQTSSSTASTAALKIGDVLQDGPNKGWIYCETKKGERLLVAPKDSGVMKWGEAMDFAAREKAELPSREQLDAMREARDKGALQGTFNATGSYPAGWYWSATEYDYNLAWCHRFSDGIQDYDYENRKSSVRCVRRCSIIPPARASTALSFARMQTALKSLLRRNRP